MLKQSLHYKLLQKLSPQQIQLMKLIQLPTQAFEDKLKQEVEENPALETGKEAEESLDSTKEEYDNTGSETIETDINIDDYLSDDETPSYKLQSNNYRDSDDDKDIPYASGTSFNQHLKTQLNTFRLTDNERQIAEFLVGSIDESGYIRRSIEDIVDDLAFTANVMTSEEEVTKMLHVVHDLDPAGVGARSLEECLLIQLKRKREKTQRNLAISILESAFDHFVKKHYKKLLQKFDITEEQLKEAIQEIEKLNPKPGGSYAGSNKIVEQIVPDFSIRITEGNLIICLRGIKNLKINRNLKRTQYNLSNKN